MGTESLVDDPDFFLSPEGKFNPEAELKACIKTFFHESVKESDFPVCQFIARYTWLKEQLEIDGSKAPIFECEAINKLDPKSATLAFPTYYVNSPASMFGHTLINIETRYANKILTQSVNYSAVTDETNGFVFAAKGLLGFYEGYYSVLPYYKKIQEYSDINQRDIWEFQLNLTEPELQKMVMHIRELEDIHTDYYFFDENCSYNLLFLLESARPSVHLTDRFTFWVLPVDTIKEIKKTGLIDSVVFRPSKRSKIRNKISLLNKKNEKIALEIINKKKAPAYIMELNIPKEEKIILADLVTEYVQYQYARKDISKNEYRNALLELLKVRSKMGKLKRDKYNVPSPAPPDDVHDSSRLLIGHGINRDDSFLKLGFRPAFSDLLDTDYGYNQGIQIEFCSTEFRYYYTDRKLELDNFDLINIISIPPRDDFFKPISWKVTTGISRKIMPDEKDSLIFKLNTGGGFAYHDNSIGLYYIFFEPELNVSGKLRDNFAFGGGMSVGLIKDFNEWWKCHLSVEQTYFELGDDHRDGKISLLQNLKLNRNNCLRLDISREKTFNHYNTEVGISWHFFF